MMFGVMTHSVWNLQWFLMACIDGFIMTNAFMIFYTFYMTLNMAKLWYMVVLRIVFMDTLTITYFVMWLLVAYLFVDVFANFLRDIFTFLNSFLCNDCSVYCFIMCFTFFMGLLLMIRMMSLIT